MIKPAVEISAEKVADHYDELDRFYRGIWGEHVHHGLWHSGRESPEQAVEQLIEAVVQPLGILGGESLCDVGCGYGATSRYVARKYDARVTGVTISQAQYDYARSVSSDQGNPQYLLQNWESNRFADESFDGIVSIECLSHILNKTRFFEEIRRVLRPGRRAVATVWLASEQATPRQNRRLLEPICREGCLPGMGTRSEYEELMERVGLRLVDYEDLSSRVSRTWQICARRACGRLLTSLDAWRFLLSPHSRNRVFLLTVWRIMAAYRTGAMRYGLFVIEKP
jgi:tocopherol O-methyltransferase